MRVFVFFILALLFFPLSSFSQESINQVDAQGERHGVWQKKYEGSEQVRYRGTFEHGKEVGTFNFYCQDCEQQPVLIKEFEADSDRSKLTYFSKKGIKTSTGYLNGRSKQGEWLYFHKDGTTVMTREFYKADILDGPKTTYYANGNKTEVVTFKNGKMEGPNLYYSPAEVLIKKLNYTNDELHGPAEYYGPTGDLIIQGQYKLGAKDGLWKYFKNGKLTREERFPKQNPKRQ